ncbi:MAG: hypothetical protein WBA97_34495 [Actinophytocola sp.]|uniref:hypothetical protein n=1 Tax=Actinophytocola sp. TaxID=1872138 RepID=UPI003C710F98
MAVLVKAPLLCPDCDSDLLVPVVVEVDGRIKVAEDEGTAMFTEHVMSDPENHPTFAIPDTADTSDTSDSA